MARLPASSGRGLTCVAALRGATWLQVTYGGRHPGVEIAHIVYGNQHRIPVHLKHLLCTLSSGTSFTRLA